MNTELNEQLKSNLSSISTNIKKASIKFDKQKSDILLLAVTKTVDVQTILLLKEQGVVDFGENKVQDLLAKSEIIHDCNWHFIGHLQTNKVKQIIDKVCLIHSVDSLKLAEEINKRAKEKYKIMDILLQVNISNENTKYGIKYEDIKEIVENVKKFENIKLKGLMCIAPFDENSENNRKYFKKMYKLFVDINTENKDNIYMKYLSMGMTNDYEVAIEEGANIVRIGTALFGERNY